MWDNFSILFAATGILSVGVYLLVTNKVGSGTHYLTQQHTGAGGEFFLLFGIILLGVWYFSLSPYHPIRKFLERRKTRNK